MKIPISERLLACAGFVHPGDRVADIGCDHGYLGIYLLKNGIAASMIEADINEGPLDAARRNAMKFGVRDKMSFHLSDGLRSVPQDFDCMVCAGMGADTMVSILEAAPWLKEGKYRLVLQCQSKTPMLREYLSENGWSIQKEIVLRDGRFLYTIMEVLYAPEEPRLTAAQCHFPPALMKDPSEDLPAYYQWILGGLRISAAHSEEKKQLLEAVEALSYGAE